MSINNNSNPWNPVTTQMASASSGAQPQTLNIQPQSKPETPSYAETTWLLVDEIAMAALQSYGTRIITSWVGKNLEKVITGRQNRITVRDARIINSKAPAPVFTITVENVVEFTVDPIIRERLKPITAKSIKPVLIELGVTNSEFNALKKKTRSVTRGDAEKYNAWKKNLFDLERVFNLAYNEPIVEKTKKEAFIKIQPHHRMKLKALSPKSKRQLISIIGKNFKNVMTKTQSLSVKDAILIHRISGDDIFDLSEKAVHKFSIHPDQVAELEQFLQPGDVIDKEIDKKILEIKRGKIKFVTPEEARQLNFCLKRNPFEFTSILSCAVQEAEEEVKGLPDLPLPSRGTKRPIRDDPDALPSKRQRTDADAVQKLPFNLNGLFFYHQAPSALTLPMPPQQNGIDYHEIPLGQVFNAQVALPPEFNTPSETIGSSQEFDSPLDFTATGETDRSEYSQNEQSSSSSTLPPQDLNDPLDLGFDNELSYWDQFSIVELNWDEWGSYLNS